jgi:glycerol uptake facilitator-like aquaporin
MDAAGLSGFVHLVQSGVSGAGLNGAVVLRTFGRITVRGALGWIGAGWVAWEFGSCIAKIPAMSVPYEDLTQTQKSERMKFLMKNLQHVRDDFLNAAGDTAVLILYEANPFKEL